MSYKNAVKRELVAQKEGLRLVKLSHVLSGKHEYVLEERYADALGADSWRLVVSHKAHSEVTSIIDLVIHGLKEKQ